ncbi:MAG: ATP-binding protein, partial [Ginsengibacter sp.]
DRLRLEQVITNLLTNAVKYSPDGKKVIIRYEISDENIIVSVEDFGIGIERENIDKLFERFYRVNNSLRFGGLGLGLYISANIIKAHNGGFWIESEVDKGSSFYFVLPRNKNLSSKTIHTDDKSFYVDGQVTINYNKENKWIEASWTGFQNMESIQRGCLVMLDLLKKNSCTKVLNDNTNILGNRAEAAKWGGNIWFPQMQNAGLQYFAWVYSPGAFSKLAAEKSIDIMTGSVASRFFNNTTDAEEWLKGIK